MRLLVHRQYSECITYSYMSWQAKKTVFIKGTMSHDFSLQVLSWIMFLQATDFSNGEISSLFENSQIHSEIQGAPMTSMTPVANGKKWLNIIFFICILLRHYWQAVYTNGFIFNKMLNLSCSQSVNLILLPLTTVGVVDTLTLVQRKSGKKM